MSMIDLRYSDFPTLHRYVSEEAINLSPLLSLNITDKVTVFTCCEADFELRIAVIAHPDGRRKDVIGVPVWSGYVARDDAIQ